MTAARTTVTSTALIALIALGSAACVVVDGNDDADEQATAGNGGGGATSSSDTGSGAGGSGGSGGATSSSTGSGGTPETGVGPGPSQDLATDAQSPGAYVCDGCPEGVIDLEDIEATETTMAIDGTVAGASGHGKFLVINAVGQFAGGGLLVDEGTGTFAQTVPLFCGENLVKLYFENDAGRSTFVRSVLRKGCIDDDVRSTIAWDETTEHWQLHLVRFGGSINDPNSDCNSTATCYPGSNQTDWGVIDDHNDDPVQDINMNYVPMGVENVYYPGAEDGLTLLVTNQDDFGAAAPNGTLYINVGGQPTVVRQLEGFQPKHVFIAADIDGASGTVSMIDETFDCAAEWDSGSCGASLP